MVEEPVTERLVEVAPPLRERLRPEMKPVFDIEKSVVVAPSAVDEPIAKSVWKFPVVEAAWMESCAKGEVVPKPTLPT